MILQALTRLYSRLAEDPLYEVPQPGFSLQKISFRIVIRENGELVTVEDARVPDAKGKLQSAMIAVFGETKPSGSGINPCTLWDNTMYLLGYKVPDKDPVKAEKEAERAKKAFEGSKEHHIAKEKEVADPSYSAVCRFFERWSPEMALELPNLEDISTGFGVFQILGQKKPVHEAPKVREWWVAKLDDSNTSPVLAPCLLSGEVLPVARTHPKIKSVAGAQSAGATIVSFNSAAYKSYGKEQSYNAPISENSAFQYAAALNSLLTSSQSFKHRIRIGDATTVFWTEKPTILEDCLADLFAGEGEGDTPESAQDEERLDQLQRLLSAVRGGTNYAELGDTETPFHILGLAPNVARLAVRFYHQSSMAELLDKLHDHYRCIEIIREFEQPKGKRKADSEFPPIWQFLLQTAREAKEIPPLLGGALIRSVLTGTPYPEGLFSAVMRRIQADRSINYLRSAIIKATLVRNYHQEISIMLDPTNTNPAYLLGRLFAALEKTQEDALKSVNASLRDRFYSSASATPAAVIPRILRTYQHHLAKLSPGAKINRDRLVQEILSHIKSSGFPSYLPIKDQGVFAIGYYHQRKDFFTSKKDDSSAEESE